MDSFPMDWMGDSFEMIQARYFYVHFISNLTLTRGTGPWPRGSRPLKQTEENATADMARSTGWGHCQEDTCQGGKAPKHQEAQTLLSSLDHELPVWHIPLPCLHRPIVKRGWPCPASLAGFWRRSICRTTHNTVDCSCHAKVMGLMESRGVRSW